MQLRKRVETLEEKLGIHFESKTATELYTEYKPLYEEYKEKVLHTEQGGVVTEDVDTPVPEEHRDSETFQPYTPPQSIPQTTYI